MGDQPGTVLPGDHRPCDIREIASSYQWLVGYGQENLASGLWEEDELAGHPHQWVPFAAPVSGGYAFVDHRPGATYGHVYEMAISAGDTDGRLWATSPTGLFDDLATVLETGTSFLCYRPHVGVRPSGQRCLRWRVVA
ncbi:hypothetical protein [Streptomyces sp. NPDC018031]|uniref:hypothetical protein n=1 Tax=Streptomyces sp. NPDC018031 TaxID=3365033 RepID=UPI0037925C18